MPGFCSLKVGTLFEIHDLKKTEVTVSERQNIAMAYIPLWI